MLPYENKSIDDGQRERLCRDSVTTINSSPIRISVSRRFCWLSRLSLISFILLSISFFSNHWLSSYAFGNSKFIRMGLWKFCFYNYIHPGFYKDIRLKGCRYFFDSTYEDVRDWLQPTWLVFLQIFMTLAFIHHLIAVLIEAMVYMKLLKKHQFLLTLLTTIAHSNTTLLLSFASLIFYLRAFDKNWIIEPELNYFDWSYYLTICSLCCNIFATYLFKRETMKTKEIIHKLKDTDWVHQI